MQIGQVKWSGELPPLFLAPMEDVSDAAFRRLCREMGADAVVTEFISSEALIRQIEKSWQKAQIWDEERPVGIQIFGGEIDSMRDAARLIEKVSPDWLDINYGCPVSKVVCKGAGAGILRDIDRMERLTYEIVQHTSLPVTVKTRLGWDVSSIRIVEVAHRLQAVGITALAVHARTRADGYSGQARWEWIGMLKADPTIHIPIIGNGDIDSPQTAWNFYHTYKPDALMIGRAAIGYPWIFQEIKHFFKTGQLLPPPTLEERIEMIEKHLAYALRLLPEPPQKIVLELRKHYTGYFRGLPHAKALRLSLMEARTPEELRRSLRELPSLLRSFQKMPDSLSAQTLSPEAAFIQR
ncbi:MAG: tRNA dihydrouridine synthase DusB [Bacteroidia bacterium]|nr:tRNA dihydrouridine synthase DusB [Bacteroidia bacterium]MDW8416773.1 tRNA dihydrouridine synthase DusB [Bacteroidia bacterium]